ncbi:hypothetical protein Taro_031867 [Colocasia esculenta]|uniref:RNase H type-1 domain-containing protein n=1 Tax=Colocasia esculenta TaxID=4460 RepID=A0A843W7P5_COLES|nr:hypothetical protein [Colocasia esculenta]
MKTYEQLDYPLVVVIYKCERGLFAMLSIQRTLIVLFLNFVANNVLGDYGRSPRGWTLGLLDVGFKGTPLTWSNKRIGTHFIKARLDRLLVDSRCAENTRWVLGNGDSIKFLDDVWFGEKSLRCTVSYDLQELSPSIKEVLTDHLRHLIPQEMNHVQLNSHEDLCVWTPTSKGNFTLKSAYDQIRTHGVKRSPLLRLWHHRFSRRASIFYWLILHRAVPAACSTIVLRQNIHNLVNVALDNFAFKDFATPQQIDMTMEFGFSFQPPVKNVKMVRWIPPSHGLLLNVDGASKGNPGPCGGGGIVWNAAGTVFFTLSHFYGVGTSLLSEVRAMCDGVEMALEKGFYLTQISTDSLVYNRLEE